MDLWRYPTFTQASARRLLELHRWSAETADGCGASDRGGSAVKMARSGDSPVLLPFHLGQAYGPLLADAVLEAAGLVPAAPVLRAVPDELTVEVHVDEDGSTFGTLRGHFGFFTSGWSTEELEESMTAMLSFYFAVPTASIEATPRTQQASNRLGAHDRWVMVR